jgi:preprotein translocase subunit SecG
MQVWTTLIIALQVLTALVMIGLVLIQHGKGADMGASFGSGSAGSLFGASGSANFLSRSTAACATVFFMCTLGLAYLGNRPAVQQEAPSRSVLDRSVPVAPAASAPVTPATTTAPAATPGVPAGVPAAAPAAASAPASK